jgi:glycosyltransferase involved in cell wall biosynthesis
LKTVNTTPKITVVMPAYNVAPYISETLASVFAQSFTDYEVVMVNDGSPDTEELEQAIEPYRDRVRYIKQENRGAGAARNEGLRAARGELVAFLDADDIWEPNYLEEQVKFLIGNNYDLVCADAMHFGKSRLEGQTFMGAFMDSAPPAGKVTFLDLISAKRSLITSGVVARRQPILEVGLFDESLRNSQDFDLWVRLSRAGRVLAYQRKVLLRYRFHEDSLSGDDFNRTMRELRVLDKIEKAFDFTAAERSEVSQAIEQRRASLEFELGKLYLEQGEVKNARHSFAKANALQRSWKTRVALILSRVAPGFLRAVRRRRLAKHAI